MNLIIVPEGIRKSAHISLHHYQVMAISLIAIVGLPLFFGILFFNIQSMLDRQSGLADATLIDAQRQELYALRTELGGTRNRTEAHLNAMAQRMGAMQAEVLRLNALGERLTQVAGIKAGEFDFKVAPAMGGPRAAADLSAHQGGVLTTLDALSRAIDQKSEHLTALEALLRDKQLTAAVTPSGWPVQGGWVSSPFGMRADPFTGRSTYHEGVDMAARLGSSIGTMGDGIVAYAGIKAGYGLMVEITHGQGYTTRYGHLSETLTKVGDRVTKGQPIALVGSSGRSTGPHLHFEVHRNGRAVDPQGYLVKHSRH